MARIITKELAEKIAAKLGAGEEPSSGAHRLMGVYHEGVLVATFGIRRGSEKDKGHDHVPKELHMSPGFAKRFAQCSKTRQQWIEQMIDKGLIDPPRGE